MLRTAMGLILNCPNMEECIATVKLATLQGKMKQTVRETQVVLSRRLIAKPHPVAKGSDCTVHQLVNSGLAA